MAVVRSISEYLTLVRGKYALKCAVTMVMFAFFSSVTSAVQPAAANQDPLTGPAKELEAFFDSFFTRFSNLSKDRRGAKKQRAMIPLLRHTKAKYDRSPATKIAEKPVDPAMGLISKLWMHGPKSWTITEVEMTGDGAFAKVFFDSVDENRIDPIPFGFKFHNSGKNWKIAGYVDLRSVIDVDGNWHDLIVSGHDASPEAVFSEYMDKIKFYYTPKKAKESMQLSPQVQENLSPMWLPTEDATKSLARAMMTFSQLQPRNWQLVSSDFVDKNSELVIQASSGNPVMRRNASMAAMMGSGLKFTLERGEEEWLLKSYGRSRRN